MHDFSCSGAESVVSLSYFSPAQPAGPTIQSQLSSASLALLAYSKNAAHLPAAAAEIPRLHGSTSHRQCNPSSRDYVCATAISSCHLRTGGIAWTLTAFEAHAWVQKLVVVTSSATAAVKARTAIASAVGRAAVAAAIYASAQRSTRFGVCLGGWPSGALAPALPAPPQTGATSHPARTQNCPAPSQKLLPLAPTPLPMPPMLLPPFLRLLPL